MKVLPTRVWRDRWLPILTAGLVAWQILLLLSVRVLPMVDAPFHLLAGTVIREWGNPNVAFREFFGLPSFGPNLFHVWFISRSLFPSVEAANLYYYALALLLLPVSASLVVDRLGGPWQLGGIASLFVYHFSFVWGFAGYTLAVPLSLVCLALLIDVQQRGRKRDVLLLAGLLVLLFFTHGQMAIFMVLVTGTLALYLLFTRASGSVIVALAALPLTVLVCIWSSKTESVSSVSLSAFLSNYYRGHYIESDPQRFILPVYDLIQLNGQRRLIAYSSAMLMLAPVFVVLSETAQTLWAERSMSWRLGKFSAPLIYGSGALLAWFSLPPDLPSQAFVYQRFSILVMLSLLTLMAAVVGPRILTSSRFIVACVVSASVFAVSSWSFYSDWREVSAPIRPALFPTDRQARVATVVCDPMFRKIPLFLHVGSYQTVWNKGIAATPVIDFRFGSLRRVASAEKLPSAVDWLCYEQPYTGQFDNLEYLLVQETAERPLGTKVRGSVLQRDGAWRLYRQSSPGR